jgi:hypothetical protein
MMPHMLLKTLYGNNRANRRFHMTHVD